MKRIRNVGLAVLAALALTAAVGATGASASGFVADQFPAAITSSSSETHAVTLHGLTTNCNAPSLSATQEGSTKALEPKLSNTTCTYVGSELVMKMNGCIFVYRPGAKVSSTLFEGSFDIVCPAGTTIQIESSPGPCQATIPAQTGLKATYENLGSGSTATVRINAQAIGLKHTQTGGWACPPGTFSDGKWEGNWTLQASYSGKQTGLRVSDRSPINVQYFSGTPHLMGSGEPLLVGGEQNASGKHALGFQYGSTSCTSANFSASVPNQATQWSMQAEYGGCTFSGVIGSVKMNGCSYATKFIAAPEAGGLYAGHTDISCPAGKAIEVVAGSKCTVTIPTQTTDAEGLTFKNEAGTIALGLNVKGIDYHQEAGTGAGKCTTGDYTNGTYTGSSTLFGIL
ncbi:MAG TPA: hypothetical protein VFR04_07450 [Solirubrobacterales bacterium]|nr:hypothetical protein [Solirubrobacterales bacterium]